MKLFYVRHGRTQGNRDKKYIGRMESPLLDEGIEGAKKAGKQILHSGEHIDVIYTSNLKRQIETAKIIAKEIAYPVDKIVVNDLLLERAGGDFEGKSQASFFAASEEEQVVAGAESFIDLFKRSKALLQLIETNHPNATVLFVGSATIGEMIRAVIKYDNHTKIFDDAPLPNSELLQFI